MAKYDNQCIAYFDPGDDLNGEATAAITGKRFLAISAAKRVGSQALATDTLGGRIPVAMATAGARPIGVSAYDVPTVGDGVPIMRGHKVLPVEAGAALTAGNSVMSDATGRAVPWTSAASEANAKCGIVLNSPTAAGQTAIVALNL